MLQRWLRTRYLRQRHVDEVCAWLRQDLPMSPRLHQALPDVLRRALDAGALQGVLIEETHPSGDLLSLCGLGLSYFADPKLMDRYIAAPQAFIFVRILEAMLDDSASPILNRDQIAIANARGELRLVVQYMQTGWNLDDPFWRQVGTLGHKTFVRYHAGYGLKSSLHEDWSSNEPIYLAAGYQRLATVSVGHSDLPARAYRPVATRSVFYAEKAFIDAGPPGTSLSYVFDARKPRCFFSRSEQELLIRGLEDNTDIEIADQLRLPLTTIKHGWRQIYNRVQQSVPFVLAEKETPDGQRGPEKRRLVLAFVEEHPEELRPFDKDAAR